VTTAVGAHAGRPGDTATRWLGVGVSGLSGDRAAAVAAARQALAGRRAELLLLCAVPGRDPAALAGGAAEVAAGAPVVGGSVGGEICRDGSSIGRVLVVALGGPGFSVATGCADVDVLGLGGAGERAAACVGEVGDRPHQVLLLLTDATSGDQQEVLRGAYRAAGAAVPLVGGACPASPVGGAAWQLHDGQVVHRSVVAAALGSDAPFGVGIGHGWAPAGDPMLVTASSGNVVHELDDEPALLRYLNRLAAAPTSAAAAALTGAPLMAGQDWDEAGFLQAAAMHPLGLRRRSGALIRSVVGADPVGGALVCAAEVPQGALVWLMHGTPASVLSGMDQACAQAIAALSGAVPMGLLAFDCVARQQILSGPDGGPGGVQQEAVRLGEYAAGVPFAGLFTAGEIARTHGVSGFHNKTVVVLAVG